MKQKFTTLRARAGHWALGVLCLPLLAWAQTPPSTPATPAAPASLAVPGAVGEVVSSRGVGFAQTPGQVPRTLGVGLPLKEGDRLTTAAGGSAILKLSDGTRMTLRPQSDLVLQTYRYQPESANNNMVLELLKGGFRAITGLVNKGNDRAALVKTPTATIGIRGTDFDARLCGADCANEVKGAAESARTANLRASAKAVAVQGDIVAIADNGERRKLVDGGSIYPGDLVETASQGHLAFIAKRQHGLGLGSGFAMKARCRSEAAPASRWTISFLTAKTRQKAGFWFRC